MVGCLANPQLRFAVAADRCSEHLFRSFVFEVELRKRGKKETQQSSHAFDVVGA